MDRVNEKSCSSLSLKDLTQIALGHQNDMGISNIAALHSVIQGILKKLNCENEVVTLYGVKAKELKELLSKSNGPLLQTDENLKVLTEKLDSLPALEKQVEEMEARLDEHLCQQHPIPLPTKAQRFSNSFPSYKERKFRTLALHPFLTRTVTSEALSKDIRPLLRNTNVIVLYSTDVPNSEMDVNYHGQLPQPIKRSKIDSSIKNIYEKSPKSDGAQQNLVKHRDQNTKNENKPNNKRSNDEVKEKINPPLEENKNIKDGVFGFNCIEDIFTIPSPENDLPRALLKSSMFILKLKEYITYPFERRTAILRGKIENLENCLSNRMNQLNALYVEDEENESILFDKIPEVILKITNNQIIRSNTFNGMQVIFDFKTDKNALPLLKEEIETMFEQLDRSIEGIQTELSTPQASAFILDSSQKKATTFKVQKYPTKSSPIACDCIHMHSSRKEPTLIDRIQRYTESDLKFIKSRETCTSKIRITQDSSHSNVS